MRAEGSRTDPLLLSIVIRPSLIKALRNLRVCIPYPAELLFGSCFVSLMSKSIYVEKTISAFYVAACLHARHLGSAPQP